MSDQIAPRRELRGIGKRRETTWGVGFLQRLLALFAGRPKAASDGLASFDRAPYRQRALDLLNGLQSSATADPSAKLAVLRNLAAKVEELFKALVTAGDRDPAVQALGELVLRLHTLLAVSQPAQTDILDLWTQLETGLKRWLALSEAPQAPAREGFWK
jgi:hypothetical protein